MQQHILSAIPCIGFLDFYQHRLFQAPTLHFYQKIWALKEYLATHKQPAVLLIFFFFFSLPLTFPSHSEESWTVTVTTVENSKIFKQKDPYFLAKHTWLLVRIFKMPLSSNLSKVNRFSFIFFFFRLLWKIMIWREITFSQIVRQTKGLTPFGQLMNNYMLLLPFESP